MYQRHSVNSFHALARSLASTALIAGLGAIGTSAAQADTRVTGPEDAIRLETRSATISEVLTALGATFELRNPSTTDLSRPLNGTYAGSIGKVIWQVLAGYDFIVKNSDGRLTVIIYGMSVTRPNIPTATTPVQNVAQDNVTERRLAPAANATATGPKRDVPVVATRRSPQFLQKSSVNAGLETAALSQIQSNASGSGAAAGTPNMGISPSDGGVASTAVPAPPVNMGALTRSAVRSLQSLVVGLSSLPQK
jgi:hypothetical protein